MKTIKIYLNIILIFLFFGNCQIIAENPVDLDFDFSSLMKSFDGEDFSKFDFDDQEDGEEYDEELLAQEEELLNLFSQQFDQVSLKENADPQENKEVKEEVKQRDEKVDQEFQQHLNKFFPKVFIAREKFFERMTPEQVANAFQEIVDIISDKPWLCLEQLYKQIVRQLNPEQKQK